MDYQVFLPDPSNLRFNTARIQPKTLWLDICSTAISSTCPHCGCASTRVHSHYQRVLKDLACFGRHVRLHLNVRRFFCTTSTCPQRIFCERLAMAAPWQRLTRRLAAQVASLTLEAGGECSARCLATVGQPVSADTLLRSVPAPSASPAGRSMPWELTTGHGARVSDTAPFWWIWIAASPLTCYLTARSPPWWPGFDSIRK